MEAVPAYKHILKTVGRLFFPNLWMVTDRLDAAGDNGEALFSYLCARRKNAVFVIKKDSPDYERLRKIGKVVPYGSLRFHLLCVIATLNLSSHLELRCPFAKEVLLQHGIANNDIHEYFNRLYNERFYLVSSSPREYEAFCKPEYLVPKERIWLTGMPRYDLLENHKEKKIFICLTWRSKFEDGSKTFEENCRTFTESSYFRALHALLWDDRLKSKLREHGYQLCIRMHPQIIKYQKAIDIPDDVEVYQGSYRELFASGSLLITDFSSVEFDFAYLKKPVLYYHFDYEEAFSGSGHFCKKGFFDYGRDGFGEVCKDEDTLRECILSYLPSQCEMKEPYRRNAETFFKYHDRKNCERVYQEILKIMGEQPAE